MKLKNPRSRFDLSITKTDRVLEVGSGNNPHSRSDVIVDKFTDTNYHRSGDIKVLKHQHFVSADGEALPFNEKEFNYVICCQVLEHVENPVKFLSEQFRVAQKGYIETPSLLGEYLFPKESHKWILHEHNDTLYIVDKKKINFRYGYDLGDLFQEYLPKHSIGFKIIERTHPDLFTIRIEWDTNFKYVVEPTEPEILQFFSCKWKLNWADDFFPRKTIVQEFMDSVSAFKDISKSVFRSKVLRR